MSAAAFRWFGLLPLLAACSNGDRPQTGGTLPSRIAPLTAKTEAEWAAQLTPEQYRVLRRAGTERAFTGAYWNEHRTGIYHCAGCGLELFRSETKFESGTGWPSFWQPATGASVTEHEDDTLFASRTEIRCAGCEGHLGHLFDDGPRPTGLRYCMNSAALRFEPASASTDPQPR